MKILILTLLLIGCSTNPKKPKTFSDKIDECISKYLDKGIDSEGSIKICQAILNRRK